MSHRIREAMKSGSLPTVGGDGKIVAVDETFIGCDYSVKPKGDKHGRGVAYKHKVLSLVELGGRTVSMLVDALKAKTSLPILKEQIDRQTQIITDEAGQYTYLYQDFEKHDFVSHDQGEYGRGQIHTNTVESIFSIFKRGIKRIYQNCAKKHLHRYVTEFDFRYNRKIDDHARHEIVLLGIVGKRLTYVDSPRAA